MMNGSLSINHTKGTTWGIIFLLSKKLGELSKILTQPTITAVISSYFINNKMLNTKNKKKSFLWLLKKPGNIIQGIIYNESMKSKLKKWNSSLGHLP